MPKYKKVRKTNLPIFSQLENIPKNLGQRLNRSVKLEIGSWKYIHRDSTSITYELSFLPGLNNEECSISSYTSWPALIDQYHYLMDKGE